MEGFHHCRQKQVPSPLQQEPQAEEALARLCRVRGRGGAPAQVSHPLGSAGIKAGHVPSKALSRSAMNSSSSCVSPSFASGEKHGQVSPFPLSLGRGETQTPCS